MFSIHGPSVDIQSEADYQRAQNALSRKSSSERVLRLLMQAFENYRGSKKIGWSRPWNKYGVRNFQSFRLNDQDHQICARARLLLEADCSHMPSEARDFVQELIFQKTPSMGFVFLTEVEDGAERYEGIVLSYGRINTSNRRFRDRFDVLLESKVVNERSSGLSRIRIFVDPYRAGHMEPLWSTCIEAPQSQAAEDLFTDLLEHAGDWSHEPMRHWKHWVLEYIDYFGPRKWLLEQSMFDPQIAPGFHRSTPAGLGSTYQQVRSA